MRNILNFWFVLLLASFGYCLADSSQKGEGRTTDIAERRARVQNTFVLPVPCEGDVLEDEKFLAEKSIEWYVRYHLSDECSKWYIDSRRGGRAPLIVPVNFHVLDIPYAAYSRKTVSFKVFSGWGTLTNKYVGVVHKYAGTYNRVFTVFINLNTGRIGLGCTNLRYSVDFMELDKILGNPSCIITDTGILRDRPCRGDSEDRPRSGDMRDGPRSGDAGDRPHSGDRPPLSERGYFSRMRGEMLECGQGGYVEEEEIKVLEE